MLPFAQWTARAWRAGHLQQLCRLAAELVHRQRCWQRCGTAAPLRVCLLGDSTTLPGWARYGLHRRWLLRRWRRLPVLLLCRARRRLRLRLRSLPLTSPAWLQNLRRCRLLRWRLRPLPALLLRSGGSVLRRSLRQRRSGMACATNGCRAVLAEAQR